MRVLVTGAGGPAGIAVVEHLRSGPHWTAAIDIDADTAGHRLAHAATTILPATDPGYGDAVEQLVRYWKIDVMVPTVAEEVAALAEHEDRLRRAGACLLLPPRKTVEICEDKALFAATAAAAGIPVPRTMVAGQPLPDGPWVVKPRRGRGSQGVYFSRDPAQVEHALVTEPDLIAQTLVPGREFTVDVLADESSHVVVQVPRWRSAVRGGISSEGEAFRHDGITAAVKDLIRVLDYRGPGNVQGCCTNEGFAFFEMNPRFSGGLPISLAAGADLVAGYLALATGRSLEPGLLSWQPGIRVVRYLTQAPPSWNKPTASFSA